MQNPTLKLSACFSLLLALAPSAAAVDRTRLDPAVRAQDDLFRAANGAWLRTTSIPPDQAEVYGADLPATINARVRAIVEELSAGQHPPGSLGQQVRDHYASYLDTDAIDLAGLAPMLPSLKQIDAIETSAQLADWQGRVQGQFRTPVWFWGGFPDFRDPGLNRILAMQGGLGMPDREYYLNTGDARMAQARSAYLTYLAALATLCGQAQPMEAARRVLALETRIAQAHTPAAEAMNPAKAESMSAQQLKLAAPGLDWPAFLRGARVAEGHRLNVMQPRSAAAIAKLFAELPLADWKLYFKLRTLDAAAPVLPKQFRAAHVAFRGAALAGRTQPTPRASLGISEVSEVLGEGLSQLYVARHFPAAQRERVRQMADRLLAAARESVAAITWMAAPTKAEALRKLERTRVKVGHPDVWRDFSALQVRAGDALGNRNRARRFEWERLAALSETPVDRGLWMMGPLEPNAYYDPVLNEINLPAGILQAPFFAPDADDAANYGGIGALIAHEISHAFDGTGSQFDSNGAQRDWWTKADRAAYDALGTRLVAQYQLYEPLPGVRVNGQLTLPENMADIMGLQVAYRAYLSTPGSKQADGAGHTGPQRFFLAYAQQWAVKRRDQRVLQLLSSDPHAPGEFRANGAAVNVDEFHAAFGTHPGDRMFKPAEQRFRVW